MKLAQVQGHAIRSHPRLPELTGGGDELVLAAGVEDRFEVVAAVRFAERLHRAHPGETEVAHPVLVVARLRIFHPSHAFADHLRNDQPQALFCRPGSVHGTLPIRRRQSASMNMASPVAPANHTSRHASENSSSASKEVPVAKREPGRMP